METANMKRDRILLNPYRDWSKAQSIPIYEGFCLDLLSLRTDPWSFTETNGALVHLNGRGDYASIFLIDIPPGEKTRPMQHCFEEVVYVLEGHGSTTVTLSDGRKRSFEWGPKSLFSIPLNCPYQIFNGSGRERARLASTNDLPVTLNLYHNEDFVFRNPFRFKEREGADNFFEGGGELQLRPQPGLNTWETNFIPDLGSLPLRSWNERGGGSSNIMLLMSDGTMHAHISEMPVGTYKKAHRHGPDFHVYCVRGEGFSMFWYEGREDDLVRFDWKHGWVFAPGDQMFHLHFNKGAETCRYYASALGSRRYPFNERKELMYRGEHPKDMRIDGAQLEYDEQPGECHLAFLIEMEKRGIKSRMGKYVDEGPYMKEIEGLRAAGKI
jgi:mannose-6-phosphate isomerase-like protein (cupin superfamily)